MMCMRITGQYVLFSRLFTGRIVLCYIVLQACIALIPTRGAKAF